MATRITNQMLSTLLSNLGFLRGKVTENQNQIWNHPGSRAMIILPSNKVDDQAAQHHLHEVRSVLENFGHLDSDLFDLFTRVGKLPATL